MRSAVFAATIASVVLFASGGVMADTAQLTADGAVAAPAAKPKKNPNDPNQMICKIIVPTGSRLGGEKTCMTRAQWEANARANEMDIEQQTISKGSTSVGK